jgi:hypothetical protein
MSIANPLWGAPRIHGEPLKLGIVLGKPFPGLHVVRTLVWRLATSTCVKGIALFAAELS